MISGTRDQIANICWSSKKQESSRKTSTSALLTMQITMNSGKFFKRWKYQTTLPASWEICMQVKKRQLRARHGTTGWFKIGKGINKGCILLPCLFNFYAQYIMWNSRLDEAQARIKIARRNISNLRYADYTTVMAETEEELNSLLMIVNQESEKFT